MSFIDFGVWSTNVLTLRTLRVAVEVDLPLKVAEAPETVAGAGALCVLAQVGSVVATLSAVRHVEEAPDAQVQLVELEVQGLRSVKAVPRTTGPDASPRRTGPVYLLLC